jgi:urease accessory protein UreE
VPALLVGKANGRVQGNRHLKAQTDEPTANLLVGIADVMGAEIEGMGVSTGRFAI